MKKMFGLLFLTVVGLASCSNDEECVNCVAVSTAIYMTQDVCPDGDGVKVTTTVGGQSFTETIPNLSVMDYTTALSADDTYIGD